MKPGRFERRRAAFTRIELSVVITIVVLLAGVLLPTVTRVKAKVHRITCVSHLKQMGFAFRIFSGDNTNLFPMALSTNYGGTKELTNAADLFRHFQVMSNELSVPVLLTCPADSRPLTHDWSTLANSNVSYFIGLDADETNPEILLVGDRNLTTGSALVEGRLTVSTNESTGWTRELHNYSGNVALADGSVQQLTAQRLREQLRRVTNAVQRLAMP
jgi:type II secretory pathway pseudopilin PulG